MFYKRISDYYIKFDPILQTNFDFNPYLVFMTLCQTKQLSK